MMDGACCGPGYASPAEAIKAPREKLLYTIAIYTGTGIQMPDYLATVDADPDSATYSQVIHRLEMPRIGDELHHMGWNACSSCHDDASMARKYLLVPGVRSNNIHIVDTATNPRAPRLHKVINGAEIKRSSFLSWVMRRARRRGVISTSTRTSRSSGGGKTPWATSPSAMTSGTSRATT
jgi:selenium-binding protein 1